VKRLFSSDELEFQKEVTILKALGPKNHPHLITLLGTYKHNEKYHLMFPYANANLRKYWDDHSTPEFDRETVLWSLKQMTGIANGLLLIHTFTVTHALSVPGAGNVRMPKDDVKLSVEGGEEWYGRHGDIKPENILWFADSQGIDHPKGVLQIADFGLGRFHGRDSRSAVNPDTIFSSPTYEPPECKLRQPVSRGYDIWSLGCLYLEFVTWLLRGSAEIDGFSNFRGRVATGTGINDDNFFTIINSAQGSKATVREQVITWTDELHAHKKCSQVIHDLLDLIMKELLVTDSKERGSASWVYQQLNLYLKKAGGNLEYLLKPVPRRQKPGSGRSNSTPTVLDPPQLQTKRNSITFLEQGKPIPIKTRTKMQLQTKLPKDLVLRNLGTPSFKPPVPHRTWPFEGGVKS
jgi:serine/threonine protein kinase